MASAASMALGAAAAAGDGPLDWVWLSATVVGIFCLEAAKNASGEIFDFESGADQGVSEADRSPFSGGKRVIVDHLLTRRETAAVAAFFYAVGIMAGLTIAVYRGPGVLGFGVAGVALAFFYHAPPLKLSYRGLGEAAVALAYGPLIACGTYWVQRHAVTGSVALASVPLGLLIAAFLWINEFPDFQADAEANKRTLVVRLGRTSAARAFGVLVLGAYALLALLPLAGLPATVLIGAAGLPHGVAAIRRLNAAPENTARLIPAQGWSLLSFVLMAVGTGVGLLAGGAGR